jgi:hypothetical protein
MDLDPQYSDWSDEALADHLNRILAEQERRQRIATIPSTIATLAAQYVEGGGDPANLSLEPAAPQPTELEERPTSGDE